MLAENQITCSGQFPTDEEIVNFIATLPSGEFVIRSKCVALDLKHYLREQRKWLNDAVYYLGINLNRQPTETEIAEELLNKNTTQIFRVFYVLKYPGNVVLHED